MRLGISTVLFFASTAEKTLFMEVTDEQRQLAQQARKYGEQMQALSESAGGRKVCEIYRQVVYACVGI